MNNSVINVTNNLDPLIGGSAKQHVIQKKIDSNLFTIYRPVGTSHNKKAAQHQKGAAILLNQGVGQNGGNSANPTVYSSYTNRFDSTMNNSI